MTERSNEQSIFLHAIGLPSPADRAAYLDEVCRDSPGLRTEVEALLAAHDRLGGGSPPTGPEVDPVESGAKPSCRQSSEVAGAVLAGRYKLLEAVGEGGMGTVWMAQQTEPVKRRVAVKLIKAGMDSKQVLARFEAERQALALMDHPNIAKVLDAGATSDARPYFVMELVKGVPITKFCDERHLTPRQRLELFVPVCQAIQHAHQKGIIHRDIKPSNVLVALYDDRPVPKVIDFGVAKATGQQLTEQTLHTGFGTVVGTVEYMSPEQAGFNQLDIDTRSDIYSLGVLLYELLTGTTPLERKRLREAAFLEVLRLIREEEPPRPSTRLSSMGGLPTLAANRGTEPKRLTALVRGELDWIVMKTLEKDRSRRYETANGFAMDVQRYLADEPVQACPPSMGYRLRKFVRRNRGPVLALAVVLLTLVGGIIGTTWGMVRAERARLAEAERAVGERLAKQAAETAEANERQQRQQAQTAEARAQDRLRLARAALAQWLEIDKAALGPSLQTGPVYELRRAVLRAQLQFYQKFVELHGDEPDFQADRADACWHLGYVTAELGSTEKAVQYYEQGRDILAVLARDHPAETEYRDNLARTHNNLGNIHAKSGRSGAAEQAHQQALAIRKELAGSHPTEPKYQLQLAATHNNLGNIYANAGRWPEAEKAYQEALTVEKDLAERYADHPEYAAELAETRANLGNQYEARGLLDQARQSYKAALDAAQALSKSQPTNLRYRTLLARSHYHLGNVSWRQDRLPDAEQAYRAALPLFHALAKEHPALPRYQRDLAGCLNSMGALLNAKGDWKEAERAYGDALRIQEGLARDDPTVTDYAVDLGGTQANLGALLRYRKPADALGWYDKAVATLKPVLDREPGHVGARGRLRNAHWGRAEAWIELGRHAEAVKEWDRVIELDSGPGRIAFRIRRAVSLAAGGDHTHAMTEANELAQDRSLSGNLLYNLACACSLSATAARRDDKLSQVERDRLGEQHAAHAVEMLRRTHSAGLFKDPAVLEHLKNNPDLKPLRARADFQKLLAEIEGKPPMGAR